ncbi:MAG: aspartate kinase [Chloroflexota bacterium]
MIVMKFGGTSVGNEDAFAQVAAIIEQRFQEQASRARPGVVVVTSAMSKVTDLLINSAQEMLMGDESTYQEALTTLKEKHQAVIDRFIADAAEKEAIETLVSERIAFLDKLCTSIGVLGELTDRGLDVVSGLGERMSAPLLAAVLRAQGLQAQFIDAADIIVTDQVHGGAEPIMALSEERCRQVLLPLLEKGIVPVVTGYVGKSEDNAPTTLGRGGSDYTAAIIGACIEADEILIWTDVNGVLTADPRVVPEARSLHELTYEEMGELAYFGAKVLHAKTVMPAVAKQIPLRVLNTFRPEHPGTLIVQQADYTGQGTVKAVTSIRKMNLITVAGKGLMGVLGMAARTFEAVARAEANVLMITQSSSEQSICFIVPESDSARVIRELQKVFAEEQARHSIENIIDQPGIAIVAIVGSGMRGVPGLAASTFTALGNEQINVIAIAQGSSEANISVVIDENDAVEAVRSIHTVFELEKPTQERLEGLKG